MGRVQKKWGQHWLASAQLADALVDLIDPQHGDTFVEVGPGRGMLTAALLRSDARVVAVEIDPDCVAALRTLAMDDRLTVIHGDVLHSDPRLPWREGPLRIVGNLPYNVSSPILRWTVGHRADIVDAHYMVQAEVAERLASPPGKRAYGLLSVLVQWELTVQVRKRLSPGAFRPPPRVRSAFVRLTPKPPTGGAPPTPHETEIVKAAFGHRRKTLGNALLLAGWPRAEIDAACSAAAVEPAARAESLAPEDYHRLAAHLPRSGR